MNLTAFLNEQGEDTNLLLAKRLKDVGLTDEQVIGCLKAVWNTCPHCWDDDAGCQCRNDE